MAHRGVAVDVVTRLTSKAESGFRRIFLSPQVLVVQSSRRFRGPVASRRSTVDPAFPTSWTSACHPALSDPEGRREPHPLDAAKDVLASVSSESAFIRSKPVDGRDEEVDARRVDWSRRLGGTKTVSVRNALGTKRGVDSLSLGGRFASSLRTTAWRAELAASRVAFIARGPCLSNLTSSQGHDAERDLLADLRSENPHHRELGKGRALIDSSSTTIASWPQHLVVAS